MKLADYLGSGIEIYYVYGLYVTPTNDFLFNNYNYYLEDCLDHYGDYEIVQIRGNDIYIDNRSELSSC